ncbi:MAG: hypothetical protein E6K65_11345 [Nitrospirae bacterium]|nr:MAG: hypothetical protein E6K65_11345 [Nitrospirota bacterium]
MTSPGDKGLVRRLPPGKLQSALQENLQSDEPMEVCLNPAAGQAIVVTDRRMIIIKAGNVSGSGFFGVRAKSFPFSQITSVDVRMGMLGGHLQVSAAGTMEVKDREFMDMATAENAVTFTSDYKAVMKEVADLIRSKVLAAQKTSSVSAVRDIASQLADLQHLREQGALTDEEFAQAKAKLLGGR